MPISNELRLHTQVIVLEAILSITRGIRVPVGNRRDPSGQCPRRINVWSEREAQRTEHSILVETQDLATDVPGCRVCQCLVDVASTDKITAL